MSILRRVDQLHIDDDAIPFSADAAFQNIRHAEAFSDFAQIVRRFAAAITHHAGATDYAKVTDLGETRENVVLNAVSKERVLLVITKIFEWQHRDAFRGDRFAGRRSKRQSLINQHCDDEEQDADDDEIELAADASLRRRIDMFGADETSRRQLVKPGQHHCDWKS